MIDFAGTLNESAVVPRHAPDTQIAMGLVGWPGDTDIVDLGTADNDGASLLKVTLHRGAPPGASPNPGESAGYRVRVRVMGPVFDVPPKGTEVCVAFPGGVGMVSGAGVLLGRLQRTPEIQYSATKTKFDVGPEQDLVLKGRSITLAMYNPDDPTQVEDFVSMSPDGGIQATNRFGFGFHVDTNAVILFAPDEGGDAKTIVRLTKEQLTLASKSDAGQCTITLKDAEVCAAGLVFNAFTAGVNLGAGATAATPANYGAAMPSATVTIQP